MSFLSILQIQYVGDSLDVDEIADQILPILDEMGIARIVLNDLRDAFEDGESTLPMHSAYMLSLIESIAELKPELAFDARGLGEEYRDTWVREFENGKSVFAVGPWDYD